MIANVSPSSLTYDDTYNTLKYASRAKKITSDCKQNIVQSNMPKEYLVKRCTSQAEEIERLKGRIKQLEKTLEEKEKQTAQPPPTPVSSSSSCDAMTFGNYLKWTQKIDSAFAEYRKALEFCLTSQSREKILKYRINLKEHAENVKKLLPLDGARLEYVSKLFHLFNKKHRSNGFSSNLFSGLKLKFG